MKLLLLALLLTSNLYAETKVSWNEPLVHDNVTQHDVTCSFEGTLDQKQTVPMPNLFYIFEDSRFVMNGNYCCHVTSTNGIGESLPSESKCKAITVNVPISPTGLGIE